MKFLQFKHFTYDAGTMHSQLRHLIFYICGIGLLAGCTEERLPRTVTNFLDDPIMLEAAIVRCSKDRAASRYDAECVNAREAVRKIEVKEEAARRAEFDKRSERKRRALRRAQEAAAEARRRAVESDRLQKEAEYLAQFGVALPVDDGSPQVEADTGNTPLAVIPTSDEQQDIPSGFIEVVPATDGGNAPVIVAQPDEEEGGN